MDAYALTMPQTSSEMCSQWSYKDCLQLEKLVLEYSSYGQP